MSHKLSSQIISGIFAGLFLLTVPIYAVDTFKVSNYENGHQIWFEVEDFDERNPDSDQYYPVVDQAGALGQAITRAGDAGGMIRWTFDISTAGGTGGTWYFWARQINPSNSSDYMLVEGDPDDADIPTGPPFPGGSSTPEFVDGDDRVFEIDVGPSWGWDQSWGIEGHTKELQNGQNTMYIFHRQGNATVFWDVFMWTDDPGYVPTDEDYQNAITFIPGKAYNPSPANEAVHEDTWVSLNWSPARTAVSHDVYFSENFADVETGAEDAFLGNQGETFLVIGFPGMPFPDGLVNGKTYYWRVDEVNEADQNSPWKGDIWSFSIPPKKAYLPDPPDGAESVFVNSKLRWTAGYGAKLHTVYFGDNFDDVNSASGGIPQATIGYTPGTLEMAKTYYWRVDEFDIIETYKGDIWSFITEGTVANPNPAKGAVGVTQTPILTWSPGVFGASHEVYFGTDSEAVKNADTSSPEHKSSGNLGSESYDPGQLEWNTTYYWRVDEVDNANADSPWKGPLWSFATADFLIIDDMESYNDIDEGQPDSNRIYLAWVDGFEDPTNGSLVGYEFPPITEQTIVHGGNQSMPFEYDNAVGKSEATLTLTSNRDWTFKGINRLSIWFRGSSSNAAEQMYVTLNGSARIDHDNPDAATITRWTEWSIDLMLFADQGVNLSNVDSITLGLSSVTGGTGTMYFDDIRLYAPRQVSP